MILPDFPEKNCIKDRVFIDTNIVVYAHLKQASEIAKWDVAFKLINNNRL
jgi:predicted nucleic acid-binding protein